MNAPESLIIGAQIGGGTLTGQFFIGSRPWGLITAPKAEGEIRIEFAKSRKLIKVGAESYCDALQNTIDLEKAGSPLGIWARGLRIAGLDDWCVPARLHQMLQFYNLRDVPAFAPGGAEAFERDWYWSSTRVDPSDAWCQYFDDGSSGWNTQTSKLWARAVRVIPL